MILAMKNYITLILSVTLLFQSPLAFAQEKPANRLIHEKSPYLLQHAYNLVDWFPWGDEAFKKAKDENKPIFLSIGYSTCHWCHVMEEESFKNPIIAALLNENFVSIKVDREERPDIDEVYMNAVQLMTGKSGWPLNVFLTPNKKPIFGGTYFPPVDQPGMIALPTVLQGMSDQWQRENPEILNYGDQFTEQLKERTRIKSTIQEVLNEEILKDAYLQIATTYDGDWGGFGEAPKFPRAHNLRFLLRYWKRAEKKHALKMAEKTLNEISWGGIYDHIGGGVHRYSTDKDWFLPHFEKMLYDQALLSRAYLEAYQIKGNPEYAWMVKDILTYVHRQLTGPEGAFYSAEDADSARTSEDLENKKEGAFYLWSWNEIKEVLTEEEFKIFTDNFPIEEDGNIEYDPLKTFENLNVIFLNEKASARSEMSEGLKTIREKLFKIRNQRPHPALDDKVLTDWNSLMISSFAVASNVLGEERYLLQAKRAADFILEKMIRQNDGRLMHRYRDGDLKGTGFLSDYAFFISALIDLYEASFELRYLNEAEKLAKDMIELFWDKENGGFFNTAKDAEELLIRPKDIYDGAMPSGNAVASLALMRLGRVLQQPSFETQAKENVNVFAPLIIAGPHRYTQMLLAIDFALGKSSEIVLAGQDRAAVYPFENVVYESFHPNKIVLFRPRDEKNEIFEKVPFLKNQKEIEGKPTAYLCHHYECELPTTDPQKLKELLAG